MGCADNYWHAGVQRGKAAAIHLDGWDCSRRGLYPARLGDGGGATVKLEGGKLVPSPFFTAERIWNRISRVMRWSAGSYIFLQTEDFHILNGFSERLYASEEIDFGRRLKNLGEKRQQHIQIFNPDTHLHFRQKRILHLLEQNFEDTFLGCGHRRPIMLKGQKL